MRLGGFVIHGNNRGTLGACLDGLGAVCDEVVAVDSASTDGSAELARERGARVVHHPWRGYGAARAAAVRALEGCDWLLYLDSDEWLLPESVEALRRWRAREHATPAYRVALRDWAELPTGRFLYRVHWRARLVRREAAAWRDAQIVHEALPRMAAPRLADVAVEHRFATQVGHRALKEDRYALLWALRAHAEGRRRKLPALQRPAHLFKDLVLRGALWRGGREAARLAWAVSGYHAHKYTFLGELERGAHPELARALAEGRYADVFDGVASATRG